jgi:hypothetical protein
MLASYPTRRVGPILIPNADFINLGYPIVVMLLTIVSWALRPPIESSLRTESIGS